MIDPNHATSYIAVLFALPVIFAYARIAGSASEIVRHMSVSLICVVGAFALRTLFWDVTPAVVGDTWPDLRDSVGGVTLVNAVLNSIFAYGLWRGMRALHLMVPEPERQRWPVWRAWLYPPRLRNRLTRR